MRISNLIPSILLFMLISCSQTDEPQIPGPAMQEKNKTGDASINSVKKLTKEAEISFQTDDIETTAIQLRLLSNAHKAYIAEENRYEYAADSGYHMTIQIPAIEFDKFLGELLAGANISKLTNKTIRINDVTAEFVDVETRLRIKKETESHYLELMKQARSITETAALEKQLSDLRSDIESTEGRMKYLSSQIDYSTVRVSFSSHKGVTVRFFSQLKDALTGGWHVFLKVLIGLTYFWVFVPVFFIGRFLYLRIRRSRRNKNSIPKIN